MDEITRGVIDNIASNNKGKSVHLTHQFLDGEIGKECGFMQNGWDGTRVSITGKWWNHANNGNNRRSAGYDYG